MMILSMVGVIVGRGVGMLRSQAKNTYYRQRSQYLLMEIERKHRSQGLQKKSGLK